MTLAPMHDVSRASLHVVTDDIEDGLEGVDPKYRAVAVRFRQLIQVLNLTHDSFAQKTADPNDPAAQLRRTEISVAVNGGQLATSSRWQNAVARVAGVTPTMANDYLRGRIDLETLLRHGAVNEIKRHGTTTRVDADGLTPYRREAMQAWTWSGDPAEYEYVHNAIVGEHFASGIDPLPSYWTSRIKVLVGEFRNPPTNPFNESPPDSGPSPERLAQLAERDAKRKTKKR